MEIELGRQACSTLICGVGGSRISTEAAEDVGDFLFWSLEVGYYFQCLMLCHFVCLCEFGFGIMLQELLIKVDDGLFSVW